MSGGQIEFGTPNAELPSNGHTNPASAQGPGASAPGDEASGISTEEREAVSRLLARLRVVEAHDAPRRRQYAIDRKYAAGHSSFDVSVPVIPTYIDILVSFIYARDPDIIAPPAQHAEGEDLEFARLFGKTLESVVKSLWKKNGLKRKAKRAVRSALTVGIGWLKFTWQESFARDPQTDRTRDMQDNMAKLQAMQRQLTEGDVDPNVVAANIAEMIAGMKPQAERRTYNGLGIAYIRPENMLVSLDADTVVDNDTASFNAEIYFISLADSLAKFTRVPPSELRAAATYSPVAVDKPEDSNTSGNLSMDSVSDNDAMSFRTGAVSSASDEDKYLKGYEVWSSTNNTICDVLEGVSCYALEPDIPNVSCTRFYPYLALAFNEVDGKRHPQSLVERSAGLADELDRSRSALRDHRSRVKPKLVFDATSMTRTTVEKLNKGTTAEMVGIKFMPGKTAGQGSVNLKNLVVPVQYNQVDPGLYDTTNVKADFEMAWGIQEALSGVTTQKTATESEIQNTGTQARNGGKRDDLEELLTAGAIMTAEYSTQKFSDAEVATIAGAQSVWIPASNIDELDQIVQLQIRGGSTAGDATSMRQQAWGALLPEIKGTLEQIGALENSDPREVARALRALLTETMQRVGDDSDPERFMPAPGQPIVLVDPATGMAVPAYPAMGAEQAAPGGGAPGAAPPPGGGGAMPPGGPTDAGAAGAVAPAQLPAEAAA